MTEPHSGTAPQSPHTTAAASQRLLARQAREKRFRLYGLCAIALGLTFVSLLFISIISKGYSAFVQTHIALEVNLDPAVLGIDDPNDLQSIAAGNFDRVVRNAFRANFPEVKGRRALRALDKLISPGAGFVLREKVLDSPSLLGSKLKVWVPADDDVDMLIKGYGSREAEESGRRLKDSAIQQIDQLLERGLIEKHFNTTFFTAGDSREPELSGIRGAAVGSFYTLLVTLMLAFPIGIAAACYLEEFAPKNRWTDLIEVNINNLAAVPSIVFGLLGLAVFINFMGLPRSAPLVGGLVLALMTLPTIIISARAALKSVPPSIREAALGMGASRVQTVTHHVLPLAMPGMLTGTIIGMAQALGETAPLLMIGMVAFVVDIPGGPLDASTALPVQIYLWADSPERGFVERTSAAIMVLLAFLITMNALAVVLRRRFERRW
jgi:phosphate transport system permease protein